MLTEAGRRYIAANFGINDCWVYSGLTWDVHEEQGTIGHESGGTGLFMSNITCVSTDHIVLKTPRTGTFYLSTVEAGNGGNAIVDDDIFEIRDNDGYPAGEAQYCAGGTTPTPAPGTPTPTPAPTGTMAMWLGGPAGAEYSIDNGAKTGTFACSYEDGGLTCVVVEHLNVPGTHRVQISMANCTGYDDERFYPAGRSKEYKLISLADMGCEYDYSANINVSAYKSEAPTEALSAISGVYGSDNKCITPCTLTVPANETGSKSVALSVSTAGRETQKRSVDVTRGATLVETFYLDAKSVIIHISEGAAFIDAFGGGNNQQWFVGEIKEPEGTSWVTVVTSEAADFFARLYFTLPGETAAQTRFQVINTQPRLITPMDHGADARLYWPYTVGDYDDFRTWIPTQWEVERDYVGTWELWGELFIIQ